MSHFQLVRPRSSKIHPGVAVVSFVVSPSRVIVKRSIKKRFRGKRINKLVGYYIYGADLQSFITRAFSNAEASLQFRDLFVPTGCWGEKKCKGEGGGGGLGNWACAWDRKGKERHARKTFPPSHSSSRAHCPLNLFLCSSSRAICRGRSAETVLGR